MEFNDFVQKQTKNVCYVKEETAGVKYTWVIQQQELLLDKFNLTVSFQFSADGSKCYCYPNVTIRETLLTHFELNITLDQVTKTLSKTNKIFICITFRRKACLVIEWIHGFSSFCISLEDTIYNSVKWVVFCWNYGAVYFILCYLFCSLSSQSPLEYMMSNIREIRLRENSLEWNIKLESWNLNCIMEG